MSCNQSCGWVLGTRLTDSHDSNVPQRNGTPGPPQHQQNSHSPPVELPTSPGVTQGYPAVRTFSWATGGEPPNRSSRPS